MTCAKDLIIGILHFLSSPYVAQSHSFKSIPMYTKPLIFAPIEKVQTTLSIDKGTFNYHVYFRTARIL